MSINTISGIGIIKHRLIDTAVNKSVPSPKAQTDLKQSQFVEQNQNDTQTTTPAHQTTEDMLKNILITEDRIKQSSTKLESFMQAGTGLSQVTPEEPKPVAFGLDYYQQRAADFQRRNPGIVPPDYYLEYGDKYANRFASLNHTDLSPEGLAWRDRTLLALQQAIENKRAADPEGFAELERDPEAFKAFAYETHSDAYVDSGLFDLPAQDFAVIAATPDIGDVLTRDGIDQTLETVGKIDAQDLADIVKATAKQNARDMPGAVAHESERILDRFVHHTDWSRFPPLPSFPRTPNPLG